MSDRDDKDIAAKSNHADNTAQKSERERHYSRDLVRVAAHAFKLGQITAKRMPKGKASPQLRADAHNCQRNQAARHRIIRTSINKAVNAATHHSGRAARLWIARVRRSVFGKRAKL
jgi:hypothetical protein